MQSWRRSTPARSSGGILRWSVQDNYMPSVFLHYTDANFLFDNGCITGGHATDNLVGCKGCAAAQINRCNCIGICATHILQTINNLTSCPRLQCVIFIVYLPNDVVYCVSLKLLCPVDGVV